MNSNESLSPKITEENEYEAIPGADYRTHMMAGAMAGVAEYIFMFPIDSVKTRMQSLHHRPYRFVTEGIYKMVRYEGLFQPLKGMSIILLCAGPAHALYFASYEHMKRLLSGTEDGSHRRWAQAGAGCCAAVLHDTIMNPAEVVKQRMQMSNSPYKWTFHCLIDIWKREGFIAFYRSYFTSLSMNIPTQSIQFTTYEAMQDLINNERLYNPKAHILSGAVAGGFAAAVTTPLDVCKTLLNTQERPTLGANTEQISGLWSAAAAIYRSNGLKGYLHGIWPRVLYNIPSTAISWSVYETLKSVITDRNQSQLKSEMTSHSGSVDTETNIK